MTQKFSKTLFMAATLSVFLQTAALAVRAQPIELETCSAGKPYVESPLEPEAARNYIGLRKALRNDLPNWTMTQGEDRLLKSAASGTIAYAGPCSGADSTNDPVHGDGWTSERMIDTHLIRWLVTSKDAALWIDPNGVRIVGARINGHLELSGASIAFPLALTRSYLPERADFSFGSLVSLNLAGSRTGEIYARGLTVRGDLILAQGFQSMAPVNLAGAVIGGNLECWDGRFTNSKDDPKALKASGIKIDRIVLLSGDFHSDGEIDFENAQIGGSLVADSGTFLRPGATAIMLDGARIRRDLSFGRSPGKTSSSHVEGRVSMRQAEIGGDVQCYRSTLSEPLNNAFEAVESTVKGNFRLHDGCAISGIVDLSMMNIGGDLDFRGAQFVAGPGFPVKGGASQNGLIARSATIQGAFDWREIVANNATTLNLTETKAGLLRDDVESWPSAGNLLLEGFVYGSIDQGPTSSGRRIEWIKRQPVGEQLRPQPYLQLVKVFDELGQQSDAVAMQVARVDAELRYGPASWWDRLIGDLEKFTVSYGYRPWKALIPITALVLLGRLAFGWGYHRGLVAPADKEAYEYFQHNQKAPAGYPRFDPLLYSIDALVPIIDFRQEQNWSPDPESIRRSGKALRGYYWSHRILGRLMAFLYAAGAGIGG